MKNLMKRGIALTATAAMVMGTMGVTAMAEEAETIKIAGLFNYSGANADTGILDGDGAQFAIDWINEKGGIQSLGGAKLEYIQGDTLSDSAQAKAVAERVLSENPDIVGAVGAGGSGYTIAMGSVFEKNQIPYVQNGVSSNIPEQGYSFTFQPVPNVFGQTQIEFIQYMNENYDYNISKVGIIYEDTDYGISTAAGNLELAQEAGLEVVFEESFPANGSDVSSLITNLKASGAEIVLPVAFTQDAKLIFNTMSSMDYHPLILGGGAGFLYPSFAEELGDAVDGVLSVASLNWDSTSFSGDFADVASGFEEKYGYFMSEHSAGTFNHVYIIAQALEEAGTTDGAVLADTIRNLSIPTVQGGKTGMLAFDENGANTDASPVIVQWQKDDDGTYRPHTIFPENLAGENGFVAVE
ncbi:MAG: ABC transporter substrate-binding protein [Lachnospiraceae bacterium]|nr:ABC transporter substrate-binding protein [Lachnospiraceae bacterium]